MLNDSGRVIRAAFLISLAGHCLFLGAPGFDSCLFNQKEKQDEIVINVEIEKLALLPRINIMGEEKKFKEIEQKPDRSKPHPLPEDVTAQRPVRDRAEEKLDVINPDKDAMLRYQDMVKQRIEEVRRYPYWAKRQGIEGVVGLSFAVLSNGISRDIEIVHSSGSKPLDEEAVATIKRADPFPPIPSEITISSVRMEISIVFALR